MAMMHRSFSSCGFLAAFSEWCLSWSRVLVRPMAMKALTTAVTNDTFAPPLVSAFMAIGRTRTRDQDKYHSEKAARNPQDEKDRCLLFPSIQTGLLFLPRPTQIWEKDLKIL